MENEYVKFAGEPDEAKVSSPVRRGIVGKVPSIRRTHGNSLAIYPTATEGDGRGSLLGFVKGDCDELGYFSLSALQTVRGRLGLPIERDRFFQLTPLKELMG